MNRRKFIVLSGAAVLAAGSAYWYMSSNGGKKAFDFPDTLSKILDSQAIILIGRDYLAKFPKHNDRNILLQLLKDNTIVANDVSRLGKAIEKDFETGNTMVLNGWVVSLTEARQCALYSLN